MAVQPTHSSRRILLPVRHRFIVLTLLVALAVKLVPVEWSWVPDWVALVLAFWCIREPLRVGMGTGFVLGVLMDVNSAAAMGQHALAYVLVAYAAGSLSRRVLWFPPIQQALHILPILVGAHVTMIVVRIAGGGDLPTWGFLAAPFVAAFLWPPLTYMLLLPQYQPIEKDDNRPI